jgi:hypothetical protein
VEHNSCFTVRSHVEPALVFHRQKSRGTCTGIIAP